MAELINHNRLQAKIFTWIWNEHPELRYLCFSVTNNLTTETEDARRKMGQLKSLGVVKGVLDLIFYYKGRMYAFDIKVGKDKLSTEQKEFIAAITKHGGYGCEIRSLEEFKEKINRIVSGELL